MSEQEQGQVSTLPGNMQELVVLFDPKTQRVGLRFDNTQFLQWDFIIGTLEMAKEHAKDKKREAVMVQMQQQQAMMQQQAQIEKVMNAKDGVRRLIQA